MTLNCSLSTLNAPNCWESRAISLPKVEKPTLFSEKFGLRRSSTLLTSLASISPLSLSLRMVTIRSFTSASVSASISCPCARSLPLATLSRNWNSLQAFINTPLAASLREMPSTNLPIVFSLPTSGT